MKLFGSPGHGLIALLVKMRAATDVVSGTLHVTDYICTHFLFCGYYGMYVGWHIVPDVVVEVHIKGLLDFRIRSCFAVRTGSQDGGVPCSRVIAVKCPEAPALANGLASCPLAIFGHHSAPRMRGRC